MYQHHLESLLKCILLGPTSKVSDLEVWSRAQECVFLSLNVHQ